MHFEGEFRVPGTPSEVIRRFEDVPRMASCMPGAVLEPQAEDGSWPGKMIVAFGPKKVAFKGKVTTSFDQENHSGTLHGRGTADMRAARIGVKVSFTLRPDIDSAEPWTIVKIVSDAELGGVLADFARTGGVAIANVIMADFARRASEEFSKDGPAPSVLCNSAGAAMGPATSAEAAPTAPVAAESRISGSSPRPDTQSLSAPDARAIAPVEPAASAQAPAGPAIGNTGAGAPSARPSPAPPQPGALSAHGLLWAVLKAQFARLAHWLGLRARDA
jgi:carbon monoxide dehydrogenase subunit G